MKIKSYAPGGVVKGPSHEEGGVPVVADGQQIAEVEGEERIFSIEDTQEIEQMAIAIGELPASEADNAAKQLGYRVVDMIGKQDATPPQESVSSPSQGQENMEEVDPALAGLI